MSPDSVITVLRVRKKILRAPGRSQLKSPRPREQPAGAPAGRASAGTGSGAARSNSPATCPHTAKLRSPKSTWPEACEAVMSPLASAGVSGLEPRQLQGALPAWQPPSVSRCSAGQKVPPGRVSKGRGPCRTHWLSDSEDVYCVLVWVGKARLTDTYLRSQDTRATGTPGSLERAPTRASRTVSLQDGQQLPVLLQLLQRQRTTACVWAPPRVHGSQPQESPKAQAPALASSRR